LTWKSNNYRTSVSVRANKFIIDLVFANNKIEIQVIHEPKITDHAWLKVELSAT